MNLVTEPRILMIGVADWLPALAAALSAHGFVVMRAAGVDAARSLAGGPPDLVVLDVATTSVDTAVRLRSEPALQGLRVLAIADVPDSVFEAWLSPRTPLDEVVARACVLVRDGRAARQTMDRRQTEEALRERVSRAKAMVEVARAITSSLDLPAVLERIVDQASRLLRAQRVALAVLEGHGVAPGIRFVASRGLSREFIGLRPVHWRDGTTAAAIAERRPVWSANLLDDPAFALASSTRRVVEAEGYRAALSVPLLAGSRTLGAIVMYRDVPGPFTGDEIDLLQVLAAQASVAIENAELYAETERRRREAEVMAEVAREIGSSLELDIVLERVTEGARELCAADFACIALRDPVDETMRFRHGPGTRTAEWTRCDVEPGKGAGGLVLVTGQPFRTERYMDDPRITKDYVPLAVAEGAIAEMVVPIRSPDGIQGLLYVTTRSPRTFTDHDEGVLVRLASYAGAAIRNAALYEQLRNAHESLETSQAQLVQTERLRALGEMAAGVAHDFNNLLAVILGRGELLLRRATDPILAAGLEAVVRAAQDGAETVRRIQEFTRTRASRPYERVDLEALLRGVVDLTRPRWKDEAQSRGIQYDVRVEGEAPPIEGRPEELREVFTNLVNNALEAMPDGGTCDLRLAVEHDGERQVVAVSVTDSGTGLSDADRRRVFEPFFTSKGPRGTGLGLAVSWSIVTRHGGTIAVQSEPGQGARFVVRLPVPAASPDDAPLDTDVSAPRAARILVIDDEAAVRSVVRDILGDAGYTVLEANDGVEGLTRCGAEPVDLVLSDISMPGLSGWDVAAACRSRHPDVPFGLVTGWGDQLDPGRVESLGVRFVIAKPFRAEQVLREVARALRPPRRS